METYNIPNVVLKIGGAASILSFIWRNVIPHLSSTFRCLAPDLLGLGDTETVPGADWSLPAQAAMLVGLLDMLGLERVNWVR